MRKFWDRVIIIIAVAVLFAGMINIYIKAKELSDLPRKVRVISRSEKIIRVYDASAIIKNRVLLIQDAVLISETDVSRFVE